MSPSESHNASMPRLVRTPISYRSSKRRASNTLECACSRHREMETCILSRESDLLHVNSDQSADNKTNVHRYVKSNNYHDAEQNDDMHDFFSNGNRYINEVERSASQPPSEVQNSTWSKYINNSRKNTFNNDDDYLIQVDEVKCNEQTQENNANNSMLKLCNSVEMKLTLTDEECTLQIAPPADVVSGEQKQSELSSKVVSAVNTSHQNSTANHFKCNHSCELDNVMYNTKEHNNGTTSENYSKHANSDKIITEDKEISWRDKTCNVCRNNNIAAVEESKNIKNDNYHNVETSDQDSCNTINNKSSNDDENNLINDTKCKEVVYRDIGITKSNYMHVKREVESESEKCLHLEEMKQEKKEQEQEQREEECVEVELEREMQRAEQIAEAKLLEDINELWCEMYYNDKIRKHHHQQQQQEEQLFLGNTISASNVASNEDMNKLLPVTKLPSLLHANDRNDLITKGSANANCREHNNECEKVECVNNMQHIIHNVDDECHYNDSNANNYYTYASKVEKVNEFDNINISEIFTLLSPSHGEHNVEEQEESYQCLEDKIECADKWLSVFDTLVTETTTISKPDNAALFSISKTLDNSSSCKISNTINADVDEQDDNEVINLPTTVAVTSFCIATTQKSTHKEISSEPVTLIEQKECQEYNIANERKDSNDHYSNDNSGENADYFEKLWYVCHDSQTNLEELKNENMKSDTETCYQEEIWQEELEMKCNEYINNDLLTCNTRTEKASSLIVEGDAFEKQEQMITKCIVSRDMANNDSINLCTNKLNDTNNSINATTEKELQSSSSAEMSNTNEYNQVKEITNTICFVDNDLSSKEELTSTCHEEQIINETTNSNDNNNYGSVKQLQEQSFCNTKVVTPNNINKAVSNYYNDDTHLDDKNNSTVICDSNEIPHNSKCENNELEEEEEEQMHKNNKLYKLFYPYFYWCYHDNEGDSNNTFTIQNKCHYDSNVFCSDNICGGESTLLTEYAQEDNAHETSSQETLRCVNSKCKGNHHHYYHDCCFSGHSSCHGKQHTHLTRHILVPPLDLSCLYIPNNEVLMEMYNNAASSILLEASSSSPSLLLSPSPSTLFTLVEVEEKEVDSNNEGDMISNNIINNDCMSHSSCKNVTSDGEECNDKNDTNNNSSDINEIINIDKNMANKVGNNAASVGRDSKTVIAANTNAIKTHSAPCENVYTCEHDAKWTNNSNSCSLTLGKKVVFRDESDALDDMHRNATRVNECHQLFRIEFLLLCSHEQRVRRQIAQDWEHEFNRISQCAHALK